LGFLLLYFDLLRLLLPVQYGQGVLNGLLLLGGLLDLTLKLLLSVEGVELGVDLFLEHLLFNFATLINELLLALNLSAVGVEFAILAAKGVILHFEPLVVATLHFSGALFFIFALEALESLVHLLADLLGRFQIVVELLLVHLVLSCEHGGEAGATLLKVGGELVTHLLGALVADAFDNSLVGFVFPVGAVSQVAVTRQLVVQLLHLEFLFSACVDRSIGFKLLSR